jgi:hypothetical protein
MTAGEGRGIVNRFKRAIATTTVLVGLVGVAQTPAMAQERYRDSRDARDSRDSRDAREYRDYDRDRDRDWRRDQEWRRERDREWRRDYERDRRYARTWQPSRYDYVYRGYDNRYYCRRSDGTTGLIVGGITGGVLGNIIAPGDSRTLGTILGAAGGAIVGRSIDRNNIVCR